MNEEYERTVAVDCSKHGLLPSDFSLANQVALRVRDRLRYVGSIRRWYVRDGTQWKKDNVLEAQSLISDALSDIASELLASAPAGRKTDRGLRVLGSWRKLRDVMLLVRVQPGILIQDVSELEPSTQCHRPPLWARVKAAQNLCGLSNP